MTRRSTVRCGIIYRLVKDFICQSPLHVSLGVLNCYYVRKRELGKSEGRAKAVEDAGSRPTDTGSRVC